MSQMIRPTFSPDGSTTGTRGRSQVGREVHVRLLDADEPLDRRAVEHDQAVERVLELPVGHLDVLDRPEDVGELQAQELDLLALGPFEDLRAACSDQPVPAVSRVCTV
jgi:hypothetical protein